MRTSLDCIPCFVQQTLATARLFCDGEESQLEVMRDVLAELSRVEPADSPPAMAQRVHRQIRDRLNNPDPYRELKREFNRVALDLLPEFRGRMRNSLKPFAMAVRLAIAGNLMDFGVRTDLEAETIAQALEEALEVPLRGDAGELWRRINEASSILYLADNAGEIVLDRLLLEQLPLKRTALVVRGAPILNDVTLEDVQAIGLPEELEIISNGSDAPGTVLEDCSPEFVERFRNTDLVIAKGQGNYETLSSLEADMVFLLKVKCPVIARSIGHPCGSHVVKHSRAPVVQAG